jgi:hypothetical protein
MYAEDPDLEKTAKYKAYELMIQFVGHQTVNNTEKCFFISWINLKFK